jgi:hypothetical protein
VIVVFTWLTEQPAESHDLGGRRPDRETARRLDKPPHEEPLAGVGRYAELFGIRAEAYSSMDALDQTPRPPL